jgi:hypothetical protein
MQSTLAVEDIKFTLPELLDQLAPGDEVILTRNQKPVANGRICGVLEMRLPLDTHALMFAGFGKNS